MVNQRPNQEGRRLAVRCVQIATPYGARRRIARRITSSSSRLGGRFTIDNQSRGASRRPVRQQRPLLRRPRLPPPQAAPAPRRGPLHPPGQQHVPLDVPTDDQRVRVRLHRQRLELPPVQMPGSSGIIMGVPPHAVRMREPAPPVPPRV